MTVLLGRLVSSELSVADAGEILRTKVLSEPRAAQGVWNDLAVLRRHGNSYELDRGTRILAIARGLDYEGALTDSERHLFERERALGSQSLRDSFAELTSLVPGLARASAEQPDPQSADEWVPDWDATQSTALNQLVGRGSDHPDALARTDLAYRIVHRYLTVRTGDRPTSDLDQPTFEQPFDTTVLRQYDQWTRTAIPRTSTRTP